MRLTLPAPYRHGMCIALRGFTRCETDDPSHSLGFKAFLLVMKKVRR
jgi:hypothetical protein